MEACDVERLQRSVVAGRLVGWNHLEPIRIPMMPHRND